MLQRTLLVKFLSEFVESYYPPDYPEEQKVKIKTVKDLEENLNKIIHSLVGRLNREVSVKVNNYNSLSLQGTVKHCRVKTGRYTLSWPLTKQTLFEIIREIIEECDYIEHQTVGCPNCPAGSIYGYNALNTQCSTCKGRGILDEIH